MKYVTDLKNVKLVITNDHWSGWLPSMIYLWYIGMIYLFYHWISLYIWLEKKIISVPGSGNSWLRYLIQKSTGYVTGSQYGAESKGILSFTPGFPGQNFRDGSAIVIKSHLFE